ncbi:MAG: bifunctional isocitrate dehydrogenase kinase/phosphatase [Acidiferrobacterales bacterium]|nr:bifunctional isocitrate dehydrogenase kinase/phosphatase [Acidiferrobacterales bacterium]
MPKTTKPIELFPSVRRTEAVAPPEREFRQSKRAKKISRTILRGFERHFTLFQEITAGAQERFEMAAWGEVREAARRRIHFYDKRIQETITAVRSEFEIDELDEPLWEQVKIRYIHLLLEHRQPELAESYYNSVFCKLFDRRYYKNTHIFVRSSVSTEYLQADKPIYRSYYPSTSGLQNTIADILTGLKFNLPYENLTRDVRNILRHLGSVLPREQRSIALNYQIDVLSSLFFRNKAAYLIGRVINDYRTTPFIVPILNNENGALYVDALLLNPADLDAVFGFSRAYFMVETQVPSATVRFLMNILPEKSKADLYSAIGFHKQGKTAFYRDFLHHLQHSNDKFVEAPGTRGMVMMVFTLPSYRYVFKLIKDAFEPPKKLSRSTVIEKYHLVKQHDRVGRLADTLEYSDVALPRSRFSDELLDILQETCARSIVLDGDLVVLKHVYIEHRMIPLNLLLQDIEKEEEALYFARGYGDAIKEMAAANIFPGDMLLKNFGVTRNNRVVFYDYDEIRYLSELKFRKIPPARNAEDEMSTTPWFSVGEDDVFPEEFEKYFLLNRVIGEHFREAHGDLMTVEFWREKQQLIRDGVLEDVYPYRRSIRFPRGARSGKD